jgi:hypothetical protein
MLLGSPVSHFPSSCADNVSPKKHKTRAGDAALAAARYTVARNYLELAELKASDELAFAHNAAAGNAVLASIAASDAICCIRIHRYSVGDDHTAAVDLLREAKPEGPRAANDLARVLAVKDQVHYSGDPLAPSRMQSVLRSTRRLVGLAEELLGRGS